MRRCVEVVRPDDPSEGDPPVIRVAAADPASAAPSGFTGSVDILGGYAMGLPGLPPDGWGFTRKTLVYENGVLTRVDDRGPIRM